MITGYNTDVEHGGVVYHVQTEDKGVGTPLILSLVYTGGAILASRRTPYHDLIAAGFDENVLAERLKRQHRLICAAITAGRIEDLKRRVAPVVAPVVVPPIAPPEAAPPPSAPPEPLPEIEEPAVLQPPMAPPRKPSAYTVYDPRRQSRSAAQPEGDDGLRIGLVNHEHGFRGGESFTLQVLVTELAGKGERPVNAAAVSVKVLGTMFRPVIYSAKTNRLGVSSLDIKIPQFNSGRAAILIRATARDLSTETRRVIYPGS